MSVGKPYRYTLPDEDSNRSPHNSSNGGMISRIILFVVLKVRTATMVAPGPFMKTKFY